MHEINVAFINSRVKTFQSVRFSDEKLFALKAMKLYKFRYIFASDRML